MESRHRINMKELEMKNIVFARLLCLVVLFTFPFSTQNNVSASAGSGVPYSTDWRISGPSGGDVRALVVDPSDPERFYFGTLNITLNKIGRSRFRNIHDLI